MRGRCNGTHPASVACAWGRGPAYVPRETPRRPQEAFYAVGWSVVASAGTGAIETT